MNLIYVRNHMSYVNVWTGTSELCECLDIDITHVVPDINKVRVIRSQEFDTGRVPKFPDEYTLIRLVAAGSGSNV